MKKLISSMLVIVMLLAIMPLTVFATTGTDGLVYELSDDGTYYIVKGYNGYETYVTIPSSYNNKPVKEIGNRAFCFNDNLKSLDISNSVTTIGEYAFSGCNNMSNITFGSSVAKIGYCAFYACYGLESMDVDPLNEVYHSSNNCIIETKTKTLVLGNKNSIIPEDGSVIIIGSSAFAYCGFSTIKIPETITNIERSAFSSCGNLRKMELPNSLIAIGSEAFSYCVGLTSIKIPNSVRSIGADVFYDCLNLVNVYCELESQPSGWNEYWGDGCPATIHWGYKPVVKITTQPKTVSVQSGKVARVTVNAKGDGLTYKWYFKNKGDSKFSLTDSYKSNTYSLEMNATRAGRQVYCVITDKYGNEVKTNTVTLGMSVKITKQPTTVAVQSGKQAKVTVSASGEGRTYKWYYKDKGATKFTLTNSFKGDSYYVEMNGTRAGRQVYCVITDKYGNSVKTDTVTLGMAVKITKQPTSVTVANGKTAKVTVSASGEGRTYKWYFKDKGATKFSLTTSFTGDSYYVTMTNARAGRQVYCVITDKYGNSVKTNTVTLNKK